MNKRVSSLILRYIFLLLISLGNFWILYKIFTPLTLNSSYFILKLFYSDASIAGNVVSFSGNSVGIISACVAGAAYFLLLLLNLGVSMSVNKRIKSLCFIIISFFIVNIIRIVVFSILFAANYSSIDILHKITWHILSIVFVIGLWFIAVKIFKIKEIPLYSDLKYVYSLTKSKKKR